MLVFILAFVLITLLTVYYVSSSKTSPKEYVKCVEAGPTSEVTAEDLEKLSFFDNWKTLENREGKSLDRSNLFRVVVNGDCMHVRHIVNGTQLLVAPIDKKVKLDDQVCKGDILMIHIPDTGVDKIRELDSLDKNFAYTFYYNPDSSVHPSSRPHGRETVVGVVRYRI